MKTTFFCQSCRLDRAVADKGTYTQDPRRMMCRFCQASFQARIHRYTPATVAQRRKQARTHYLDGSFARMIRKIDHE